jgi:hypothetical protein
VLVSDDDNDSLTTLHRPHLEQHHAHGVLATTLLLLLLLLLAKRAAAPGHVRLHLLQCE